MCVCVCVCVCKSTLVSDLCTHACSNIGGREQQQVNYFLNGMVRERERESEYYEQAEKN